MYVSDYGFASDREKANNWKQNLNEYSKIPMNKNDNWMYMGLNEWTISRQTSSTRYAFHLLADLDVNVSSVHLGPFAIRPCFYLNSMVKYAQGKGEKENPYRTTLE